MDNIIKSILESYKVFGRQKEKLDSKTQVIKELNMVKLNNTSYSNLKFDSDGTQNDSVNKALLDDINAAAKKAGIVATITTAKSGHNKYTKGSNNVSRHMNGTGVDVAILDGIGSGGATNSSNGVPQFREKGEKLKNALKSMGYVHNTESGNDKAVLWQTNTGGNHFNHLHISNRVGVPSEPTKNDDEETYDEVDFKTNFQDKMNGDDFETTYKNKESDDEIPDVYDKFVDNLIKRAGLMEEKVYGNFGKKIINTFGSITIPKDDNKSIFSPVEGVINDIRVNTSCRNQTTVEHKIDNKKYYLQFCGMTNKIARDGDSVLKGSLLGKTSDDVTVTLYDSLWDRQYITPFLRKEKVVQRDEKEKIVKRKNTDKDIDIDSDIDNSKNKSNVYKKTERYADPLGPMLLDLITSPFRDKYDENGKLVQKRWAYPTDKVQPDPFIKDFYQKYNPVGKKRVKEDIEKIKKLLK